MTSGSPSAPTSATWRVVPALLGTLVLGVLAGQAAAQEFTYNPPGVLTSGSGEGRVDFRVYVDGMRFPIEQAPAYANSQVWGNGGSRGPGGSQCDAVNYSYPWWDNYCETRTWDMPLCPAGLGHQGQDIRASTCADDTHWAVAAEAGTITNIGTYSVSLTTSDGTIHRYLHMEPTTLAVQTGDTVSRGDRLGRVSNAFGTSSTTIHLHYDIFMNVEGVGFVYVPTYRSLVESYEELIGMDGNTTGLVGPQGAIIDNQDPSFVLHGPAATWRYVDSAGYDGDLYWSYVWENAESNWAEWVFGFERAGEYLLEVYVTPAYSQAQDLRYTVRSAAGEQELRVDQSAGDIWLTIGTFEFATEALYNLAVYDGPGEALSLQRQFVADALRVTPVDLGLDEPGPEPVPDAGAPDLDAGAGLVVTPDLGPPDVDEPDPGSPDRGVSPDRGRQDVDAPATDVTVNSGCGCSSAGGATPAALAWLLLIALARRGRPA